MDLVINGVHSCNNINNHKTMTNQLNLDGDKNTGGIGCARYK